LFTFGCAGVNHYFPLFSGIFAAHFSEKWSYLPTQPGKIFPIGQFLPGPQAAGKIPAGTYFPHAPKIDV
jgi:hypothetical protein